MNNIDYLGLWVMGCISFVVVCGVIIIPWFNSKTPEELEEIRTKTTNESFCGVIIDKPCCNHSFNLILQDSSKAFFQLRMTQRIDDLTELCDSIKKEKGSYMLSIKKKQQGNWVSVGYYYRE